MQSSNKALSVGRFVWKVREPVRIGSPTDTVWYIREHIFPTEKEICQEEMWALLLNTRLSITHHVMVYRGQVNNINCRGAELFREAVRFNASKLILTHNHPSNNISPSQEDIKTTSHVVEAGKLLGCDLVDHIIVGDTDFFSFKEQGQM